MTHPMTRNLDKADAIVKVVLATATIALFIAKVIAGPFAVFLTLLSVIVLLLYGARLLVRKLQAPEKDRFTYEKNLEDKGRAGILE